MIAVIFAGPSLPPSARPPATPQLEWRPPAGQGDLYRAAIARPAVIGLVDGHFDAVPSVWHKEILWAMCQGIHVCGSATIGALRAVELAPFGMKGVGRIFEAFRDGFLQDDDEVAVLHGPEELDYPPLTEAMVNIRATVERAVRDAVIDSMTAAALIEAAKSLFYKDRTYEAILQEAGRGGLDPMVAWGACRSKTHGGSGDGRSHRKPTHCRPRSPHGFLSVNTDRSLGTAAPTGRLPLAARRSRGPP
jgi:hypothetical protein